MTAAEYIKAHVLSREVHRATVIGLVQEDGQKSFFNVDRDAEIPEHVAITFEPAP